MGIRHSPQGCGWGWGVGVSVGMAEFLLAPLPSTPGHFAETGLRLSREGGASCQLQSLTAALQGDYHHGIRVQTKPGVTK